MNLTKYNKKLTIIMAMEDLRRNKAPFFGDDVGCRNSVNVKVGIVESDEAPRQYLTAVIGGTQGLATLWSRSNGKQALGSMQARCPDVVLVSLFLHDMTGIDFILQARRLQPRVSYLLLLPDDQPNLFVEALEAGACAYLPKLCGADELVRAIWTVHQGGAVVSSFVAKAVVDYFRARGSVIHKLTEREREVLTCLSRGLSQASIAIDLGIDPATVRTHVRNMLSKLDAHSTAEAIALYLNPVIPPKPNTGLPPKITRAASRRILKTATGRVSSVTSEQAEPWCIPVSNGHSKSEEASSSRRIL
jgi:DNA-binding NarL/FixJ family response regulator